VEPPRSETYSPWGLIPVRGPVPRKLIYFGVRRFIFRPPHKVVLVEVLNAGNYAAVPAEFLKWGVRWW
jgi:hypothetical protein